MLASITRRLGTPLFASMVVASKNYDEEWWTKNDTDVCGSGGWGVWWWRHILFFAIVNVCHSRAFLKGKAFPMPHGHLSPPSPPHSNPLLTVVSHRFRRGRLGSVRSSSRYRHLIAYTSSHYLLKSDGNCPDVSSCWTFVGLGELSSSMCMELFYRSRL